MTNELDEQACKPGITGMTDDQAISYLSKLSTLEYERQREAAAKALGTRQSVLDKAVKDSASNNSYSHDDFFAAVEPHSEPVNGETLLNRIEAISTKFVICDQHTRTATTLWIVLTWLSEHVDCLPIANITAPEKNCGKTTLLSFIGKLAFQPLTTSNITSSALFRAIEKWQPTLLIDEADSFADEDEAIRGIINAGHTKDSAFVIRCSGDDHEPKRFSVWGPKAMSGIGKRAGTIQSRSIELRLRRKMPGESTSRIKTGKAEFEVLQQHIARWTKDISATLRDMEPDFPETLQNRDADNWEPLFAIADCAGGRWPKMTREAALDSIKSDENMSVAQELISDIKDIFESKHSDKIFTADLLDALINIEDSPWATFNRGKSLSARQLAKHLKGYGIKSGDMRIGIDVKKGYLLSNFKDAFDRYLPQPVLSATTLQSFAANGFEDFQNATLDNDVADRKTLKHSKNIVCSVVADKKDSDGDMPLWQEVL